MEWFISPPNITLLGASPTMQSICRQDSTPYLLFNFAQSAKKKQYHEHETRQIQPEASKPMLICSNSVRGYLGILFSPGRLWRIYSGFL